MVDDDGAALRPMEPGEVVVRGYNVMRGYFEDPEKTAETIDADGWLHTGDVGVMDERGYLRITDRIKDMFIVGGFNAYPAEIERCCSGHRRDRAGGGRRRARRAHGRGGRTRSSSPPRAPTPDAGRGHRRGPGSDMANFKVPRGRRVVDALPLNASGKVLKFELRDRAVARSRRMDRVMRTS